MEGERAGKLAGWGAGLSALCAVHCAALPLLAGVSAAPHGHSPADLGFETALVGTAGAIGLLTLGPAYCQHRWPVPLALLLAGLLLLATGHAVLSGGPGRAAAVCGACFLVAAQMLNRRRQGACCPRH